MRIDIRFLVLRIESGITKDKGFLFPGSSRRITAASAAAQNACRDTEHQKNRQNLFHIFSPRIIK
jgi:hypothetical protein